MLLIEERQCWKGPLGNDGGARHRYIDFRLQAGDMAVCTDTSLKGGGLCYRSGLVAKGLIFTHSLASGHEWDDFESLGFIEIFEGSGSFRGSLEL